MTGIDMSKYIADKKYTFVLIFLICLVILVFLSIILWPSLPHPDKTLVQGTPLFTPTATLTPTPLPENFPQVISDYFENQNGTNGLLVGSVVLVLIILLGVLISIRNNEK